jgi:hypothetical protein
MIEQFFTGGAHDCSIAGFEVEFRDGASYRVYLSLQQVVQDDAAHKSVWNCVGVVGSNFCMFCPNAWANKRQRKPARSDSDPESSDDESKSDDDGIICEVSTTASGMYLTTDDDIHEKAGETRCISCRSSSQQHPRNSIPIYGQHHLARPAAMKGICDNSPRQ